MTYLQNQNRLITLQEERKDNGKEEKQNTDQRTA